MIKLLMKYLLFAGVMAVVVGCTEEKMEEVFIEQPNSFHTLIPQHYYKIFFLST